MSEVEFRLNQNHILKKLLRNGTYFVFLYEFNYVYYESRNIRLLVVK